MVSRRALDRLNKTMMPRSIASEAYADFVAARQERALYDRLMGSGVEVIIVGDGGRPKRVIQADGTVIYDVKEKAKEGKVSRDTTEAYFDRIRTAMGRALETYSTEGSGVTLTLKCEEGHKVEWTSSNRIPGDTIASKLKRLGWRLGRHPRCPEHNGRKKQPEPMEEPEMSKNETKLELVQTAPATQTQAQASEAARLAKRIVLGELETHFDDREMRYKPGHSDATIAKSAGVAEAVVANLRLEFYGELKQPSEVEALEQELIAIRRRYEQAQEQFHGELLSVRDRIDALAKKNGWKQ
jgi:hypothetical protein